MRRVPVVLVPVFAAGCGVPAAFAPGSAFAHTSYLIGFGTLVALGWARLRSLSGPQRSGYAFIVAALTVWLVGDLLQDVLRWLIGPAGDVSPADLLWISGYPLLGVGLIKLVRLRAPTRLREAVLDALVMATVMAWLCWQFVILPAAEDQQLSPAVAVGAIYPLGDVLLFAAGAILVLAPGSKRGPTRYLIAALAISLIGDISISMLPTLVDDLSRAVQADRFDGVLLVSNSLYVAALLHPDAARIAEPGSTAEQRLHPARVIFLGIALAGLPMFAGLQRIDSVAGRVSLLVSIAVLTALVLVRFLLVVREQESVRAMLAHQAHHDQLTGLANRQALHAALDLALNRSRAAGARYAPALFYLDLDGFKQVNDRYGHAAGDVVLSEFARRLKAAVRSGDVAARLGGDEFVVLSETIQNDAEAQALADRLRGLTDEPVAGPAGETFDIGVSVGIAAAGTLGDPDSDALLAAADSNMYSQKSYRPRPEKPKVPTQARAVSVVR